MPRARTTADGAGGGRWARLRSQQSQPFPRPCSVKIVSVAQMRALEAAAFAAGISEAALQERAGHVVAQEVSKLLRPGERVVVLVGHGNNGRDGAVAAEWLAHRGVPIDLVLAPR